MANMTIEYLLKTGDILFEQNNNPLSKAIRFLTRSKWSHTEIIIEDEIFLTLGSHAVGSYISKFSYRKSGKIYAVGRYRGGLPKNLREKILNHTNIKYDFRSLIYFQLRKALNKKWFGKVGLDAGKKLYCSELVAKILGIKYWWELTPQDLYSNPNIEIIFETKPFKSKK